MRDVLVAIFAVASCRGNGPGAHAPAGPAAGAAIGNARPPPRPLPPECALPPAEEGYAPWERRPPSDCLGAARTVDEGSVILTVDMLRAYDRDGRLRWETSLARPGPDGRSCGYPSGLAVDTAGRSLVSCGYSLSSFDAAGAFRWQVWPGGNHSVTPPLVDEAGTSYVGADGTLYAVAPDGTTRWQVGTGWNRYFGSLAPTDGGALVFVTGMAALHSEDTGSGHFYYEEEPPELFVVDRTGRIVSRAVRDHATDHPSWPAWRDVVGEGGGRIP